MLTACICARVYMYTSIAQVQPGYKLSYKSNQHESTCDGFFASDCQLRVRPRYMVAKAQQKKNAYAWSRDHSCMHVCVLRVCVYVLVCARMCVYIRPCTPKPSAGTPIFFDPKSPNSQLDKQLWPHKESTNLTCAPNLQYMHAHTFDMTCKHFYTESRHRTCMCIHFWVILSLDREFGLCKDHVFCPAFRVHAR